MGEDVGQCSDCDSVGLLSKQGSKWLCYRCIEKEVERMERIRKFAEKVAKDPNMKKALDYLKDK